MINVFNFNSDSIHDYIKYDLKLLNSIGESFEFVFEKLKKFNNYVPIDSKDDIDLNTFDWREGKSYNWLAVECDNVKLLIRQYKTHFTIYSQLHKKHKYQEFEWSTNITSCFTYYDKEYQDFYYDNQEAFNLNKNLHQIIDTIKIEKVWLISNSAHMKVPENIEIKNVFEGESIRSIDKLIFASEELSSIHIVLFAENEMIEKIKELKVGDIVQGEKIEEIKTEIIDNYYHSVGLTLDDSFKDVYCLTMHYLEDIFK